MDLNIQKIKLILNDPIYRWNCYCRSCGERPCEPRVQDPVRHTLPQSLHREDQERVLCPHGLHGGERGPRGHHPGDYHLPVQAGGRALP